MVIDSLYLKCMMIYIVVGIRERPGIGCGRLSHETVSGNNREFRKIKM